MLPTRANRQYNRQFNRQYNTTKKRISPIPMLQIFRLFYNCFKKRVNVILTGRFIGKTFVEHQREFVEHFQYGKQIGKILDMKNNQKRHRAPKHILLGQKSEKSGNQVPTFDFFENVKKMPAEILCIMGQTLFQTSS